MPRIVNGNILVFKLDNKSKFENIGIDVDVKNFIADLKNVEMSTINLIKNNLIKFGKSMYKNQGSFVIVCDYHFDDQLNIVPTIQEAIDFIEMEEIERSL